MSQEMRSDSPGGEAAFGIDEIFYSRTDLRGVLKAGNDVFQRVSGYPWEKLIGAPHRVIRHPDMPRAVFWLLWDWIKKGRPIAAYVKNRSETGEYYWVIAAVLPIHEGYLSVRIKPSSALFPKVRAVYAELLKAEAEEGLSPERSAQLLMQRLKEHGFTDYADFMTKALDMEQASRDQILGRKISPKIRALSEITGALQKTLDLQAALLSSFDALQTIPNNMRIIASRLEPSGGPVSAISESYKFASTDLSARLSAYASGKGNLCDTMVQIVSESVFLTRCAHVLSEVVAERQATSKDANDPEVRFLHELEQSYEHRAEVAMHHAATVSGELYQASGELRRLMLGLDTIRVMGRVESGTLGPAGAGLGATIDELDIRHGAIASELQALMSVSGTIRNCVRDMTHGAAAA